MSYFIKKQLMRTIQQFIVGLILSITLAGCGFVEKNYEYRATAQGFVTAMMSKDYNQAVTFIDFESIKSTNAHYNSDTLKMQILHLQDIISQNFGNHIRVKSCEIRQEMREEILVKSLFEGDKDYGYLSFSFSSTNNKIIGVQVDNFKAPVPHAGKQYLFYLLSFGVVCFNVYALNRVYRSEIQRKWLRTITILFLNFPTLSYTTSSGLSFQLFHFLILGGGFQYGGYNAASASVGLPIGACIVLWKLKNELYPLIEKTDFEDDSLIDTVESA